jgi:hypothetical protein
MARKEKFEADKTQDTPKNITYYTPPGESPEPHLLETEEKIGQVLKPDECVPSWFPYPGNGTSSGFKKNETRNRLSTVLELSSDSGSSEDGVSSSGTTQTYASSKINYYDDPAIIQYVNFFNFFRFCFRIDISRIGIY